MFCLSGDKILYPNVYHTYKFWHTKKKVEKGGGRLTAPPETRFVDDQVGIINVGVLGGEGKWVNQRKKRTKKKILQRIFYSNNSVTDPQTPISLES